ncbi:periaxin [Caloenas nicobarica]|uniref:periaxin n=1 Tax=Caloenas nicobarica TaxID=187106 RepID=UPI0032B783D7
MEEELDTSPSRGVAGVTVTRDRHGLIVTQAPKSLRLRPGDRLLSARVFFEGTPPEEVTRVLEGAGGCRVSLRVRRPVTRDTGDKGQRGTVTRLLPKLLSSRIVAEPAPSVTEPAPTVPKPSPPAPPRRVTVKEAAAGKTAAMASPPATPESPRDAPKVPEGPGAAAKRPQINAGGGAERKDGATKPKAPEPTFGAIRVPSIAIAVPSAAVELVPEFGAAKAEAPARVEPRPSFPAPPAIDIAVPHVELGLALPDAPAVPPAVPPGFAEGLRKLSLELEPTAAVPALEIAPPVPVPLSRDGKAKAAKFTLPRVGLAIAKFKTGGASPPASPPASLEPVLAPGGGVKLKIPKLSLAPFGDSDTGTKPRPPRSGGSLPKFLAGPESGAGVKLPKFGGSSPDIRGGGSGTKTLRRGGSAESLVLAAVGRKVTEGPGATWLKAKAKGAQALTPQFTAGFAAKRRDRPLDGKMPKPLKVPALELAPPGMDESGEKEAGQRFGVKLPKFGAGLAGSVKVKEKGGAEPGGDPVGCVNGEAQGKIWRWVPKVGFTPPEAPKARPKAGSPPVSPKTRPKVGVAPQGSPPKPRFPDVELCPDATVTTAVTPKFHFGGTPKFQLPKLVLSPQPCEW